MSSGWTSRKTFFPLTKRLSSAPMDAALSWLNMATSTAKSNPPLAAAEVRNWPLMENNITREDIDALITFLKRDDIMLTQSANVAALEQVWSEWLGVRHSVFVNSGASANLLTIDVFRE